MAEVSLDIFVRAYDQAKGVFANLEDDLGAAQERADAAGKSMEHTGAVLRKAGQAATIAGIAILAAGGFMVNAASNAEETSSKFDAVFKQSAGPAREWAKEQADSLNRSRFALEGYMSTLQDTFVPMGVARGEAAELSKTVTTLAIDLASFNNTAEPDTINDLQSALVGNHETMRKYGVIITEATLNQELLTMGVQGGTRAASEQEKMMARLNIIMKGTNDAQGDAARTADSFANSMRGLKGKLEEAAVAGGQALMPTLQAIIPLVSDGAELLRDLAETPAGRGMILAAGAAGVLGAGLGPVISMLPSFISGLEKIPVIATRVRSSMMATAPAARAMWAAITGPAGLAVLAIGAVAAALYAVGAAHRRAKRDAEAAARARIDAADYDRQQLQQHIADLEREVKVRERVEAAIKSQLAAAQERARALAEEGNAGDLLTGGQGADEYRKIAQQIQDLTDKHRMARKDLLEVSTEAEVARQRLGLLGEEERAVADAAREAAKATGEQADQMQVAGDEIKKHEDALDDLADAQRDQADQVADAQQRVADAQEDAAERQEDAQERIRDAYEETLEAAEALEDAQKSAAERVADAEERAADRVSRAEKAVEDAKRQRDRVGQKLTEEERLAQQREDANRRVAEAEAELVKAREEGVKGIAEARKAAADEIEAAEKRVQEAMRASQKAVEDAEKARIDGLERIAEAEKALARVQETMAERVAEAGDKVAEALGKVNEQLDKLDMDYRPRTDAERRSERSRRQAVTQPGADFAGGVTYSGPAARLATNVTQPHHMAGNFEHQTGSGRGVTAGAAGGVLELLIGLDRDATARVVRQQIPEAILSPEGRQAVRILYRDINGREI